jgi:hypothetical protein
MIIYEQYGIACNKAKLANVLIESVGLVLNCYTNGVIAAKLREMEWCSNPGHHFRTATTPFFFLYIDSCVS